jgi:CheY-like chemotaxis protein
LQALKLLADAPFDVLLFDARMPGMTGRELLAAVRAMGVSTPAVALSADGTTQSLQHALASGFVHYFTKPFDIDDFLDNMRAFFNAS